MSETNHPLSYEEKPQIDPPEMKVEIEIVEPTIPEEIANDPDFADMIAKFFPSSTSKSNDSTKGNDFTSSSARSASFGSRGDSQHPQDEETGEEPRLSNRQRKKLNRMTVATLKSMVKHPEVVDLHDPDSKDAELLVYLKSYRNTVPVPGHWILKRKYLSAKRGIEKSRYVLPSYIENTGVAIQREAYLAEEAKKSRKQKQREKIRPRMGKVSLNLQELYNAFFVHQTKPDNMSIHGDIYYEGKEYEINKSKFKPGHISARLREALGMSPLNSPLGNAAIEPPPWLYKMQQYGPPPSYPNLRIPGVNAPIPVHLGAQYGTQPNQWGKPPQDKVCLLLCLPKCSFCFVIVYFVTRMAIHCMGIRLARKKRWSRDMQRCRCGAPWTRTTKRMKKTRRKKRRCVLAMKLRKSKKTKKKCR